MSYTHQFTVASQASVNASRSHTGHDARAGARPSTRGRGPSPPHACDQRTREVPAVRGMRGVVGYICCGGGTTCMRDLNKATQPSAVRTATGTDVLYYRRRGVVTRYVTRRPSTHGHARAASRPLRLHVVRCTTPASTADSSRAELSARSGCRP